MSKWYRSFHSFFSNVAIAVLKDKEPGTFLIRDSNSFQGAYGLALKVATPPANANITGNKGIRFTLLYHSASENSCIMSSVALGVK